MKTLNIKESISYLGKDKFAVSLEHSEYGRFLYRTNGDLEEIGRIGRVFDPPPASFSYVVLALADWFPKNTDRLLWIDHFEEEFPSQVRNFLKILGTNLPPDHLEENPGILLGPLSDDLMDQLAGTDQQNIEGEALIALCALLNIGGWNAKLLTSGSTDFVEFWEDYIFFYSESKDALDRATEMLDLYGFKTPLS